MRNCTGRSTEHAASKILYQVWSCLRDWKDAGRIIRFPHPLNYDAEKFARRKDTGRISEGYRKYTGRENACRKDAHPSIAQHLGERHRDRERKYTYNFLCIANTQTIIVGTCQESAYRTSEPVPPSSAPRWPKTVNPILQKDKERIPQGSVGKLPSWGKEAQVGYFLDELIITLRAAYAGTAGLC